MSNSIRLNPNQMTATRSEEGDWLRLTPDQAEFLNATGPDEVCAIVGNELVRVSAVSMAAAMETAFKTAMAEALCQLPGATVNNVTVTYDPPELGQEYLRVHVEAAGSKATATATIPDPRGQ